MAENPADRFHKYTVVCYSDKGVIMRFNSEMVFGKLRANHTTWEKVEQMVGHAEIRFDSMIKNRELSENRLNQLAQPVNTENKLQMLFIHSNRRLTKMKLKLKLKRAFSTHFLHYLQVYFPDEEKDSRTMFFV